MERFSELLCYKIEERANRMQGLVKISRFSSKTFTGWVLVIAALDPARSISLDMAINIDIAWGYYVWNRNDVNSEELQ